MRKTSFLIFLISLIILLSCNNPQESNSRNLLVWSLGWQSINCYNPNTEKPDFGVTITGGTSEYHLFLTSDGNNLWSVGCDNGATHSIDIISQTGEVTEHALPQELTGFLPGGLCYEDGKFWLAIVTVNGFEIWNLNYDMSQPQKMLTVNLEVTPGSVVAKGIAVDAEDNIVWLGAHGYFEAQPSLKVLKYNLNGDLLDSATIVQGSINGGDIASGDESIWVTFFGPDQAQNNHYQFLNINKETLQITRTFEVLTGEFGIALQ
jgi:hypothetical protein